MSVAEPIEALARIQEASFGRASEATKRTYPIQRRMDGADLFAFLSRRRECVLATVRPDGRPHAAPVGYALVGTKLVFPSREDAARVRNLRHHPHISVVISEEDAEGRRVVIVDGTARLIKAAEAALDARAPFRDANGVLPPWIEVLIQLTPERLLSYSDTR